MTCDRLLSHLPGDIVMLFVISYPLLTRWLEMYIPVSSTHPVSCIAIDRDVTLCAVEHKWFRIRHKLLYAKTVDSPVVWTVF